MDEGAKDDPPRDQLYVHSQSEHGGYRVLRSREDRVEVGELRSVREGQAIVGELVKLTPTEEHDAVFDVEVLMEAPQPKASPKRSHAGPARVASNAFRSGWDRVFGPSDDLN